MEGYDEDQTTQLSTSYTTAFYLLTHHNPPPPPPPSLPSSLSELRPHSSARPSICSMINAATCGTRGVQITQGSLQNICLPFTHGEDYLFLPFIHKNRM